MSSFSCEQCEAALQSRLFCFTCNTLQHPPHTLSYFEAVGLPVSYALDLNELEERFQQLVVELHPDFYAASGRREQHQSEVSSSLLNRAVETLRNPVSRAAYLLPRLAETPLDERSLPPGFLEEMFLLQESLDDLLESGSAEEQAQTRSDLQARREALLTELPRRFAQAEAQPDPEALQFIQTTLNAERYLRRLLERFDHS